MARPEQVPHGYLHLAIVRVRPERAPKYDTDIFGKPRPADYDHAAEIARIAAFATEKGYPPGTVARVVMVSRMGDCGLSRNLRSEQGYDLRLDPECLEVVSEEERPRLLHAFDMSWVPS